MLISLVFITCMAFGYTLRPNASAPAEAAAVLDFRMHRFSDDFLSWELDNRLDLIDRLVNDAYLSNARYAWNKQGLSKDEAVRILQYIRDIQIDVYSSRRFHNMTAPYLAFGTLWHPQARGMYDYKRSMVVIEPEVLSDMSFDDAAALILHETAHHIYASVGASVIDDYDPNQLYDDFTHDAHVLWFSTPTGGHVLADFEYWSNPQEKLAWDAQNMARFIGLADRKTVSIKGISKRLDELERLKERWLKTL